MPFRNFTADNRALLAALSSGRDFTANQLRTKLGIDNISARVNDLRNAGYSIYLNNKQTENRTIRVYRLGSPTRRDIAIARAVKKDAALLSQIQSRVASNLALV